MDTQDTGKKLLQKGELKRRYTIIPLNKISSRTISSDTIRKAKSLVSEACYISIANGLTVRIVCCLPGLASYVDEARVCLNQDNKLG